VKTSFTTLGCPGWSLEQIAKNAQAFGYQGVELRTHTDGNHFSPDAPVEEALRVAQLFRDHGAPVISIMGYSRFAFSDENEIKKNEELLSELKKIKKLQKGLYKEYEVNELDEIEDD